MTHIYLIRVLRYNYLDKHKFLSKTYRIISFFTWRIEGLWTFKKFWYVCSILMVGCLCWTFCYSGWINW